MSDLNQLIGTSKMLAPARGFSGCKNSNEYKTERVNAQIKSVAVVKNKSENFQEFKYKFFNDSLFQIERIIFPLKGISTEYVFDEAYTKDTITNEYLIKKNKFYWNKKGWIFLSNKKILKSKFSVEEKINKDTAQIKIKSNFEDFIVYLKFVKKQNYWFLDYYSSEWN